MSRNPLTAAQVAARLGVKQSTVYAYVSRGALHRTVAEDGRTSRFDAAEVEELARRGRPRTDSRRLGTVDVVLSSSLTSMVDDELAYRGRRAVELARSSSFEAVAEFLWSGLAPELAGEPPTWTARAEGLDTARAVTRALPTASPVTEQLAVVTAALACANPLRIDLQPEAVRRHAATLIATLVEVLPPMAGAPGLTGRSTRRARPDAPSGTSVAERLWSRLTSESATPKRIRVLDAALILLADHELATSTLAARLAASTRADPYAVVLSGLGAVSGLLHGAAGHAPFQMLTDARSLGSPERAVALALATHGAVPGMGHPLYAEADPRATCLLELLMPLVSRRDRVVLEGVLDAAEATSRSRPNIDLATAALAFTMQMPSAATEAIFALARMAGWVAHAIEEYGEAPLRFRTRALYDGPPVA